MMTWKLTGSRQKSDAELTCLASGVFMADNFNIQDLAGFNASKEARILNEALLEQSQSVFQKDGWKKSSLQILVPMREKNQAGNGKPFNIPNFMHHSITSVIQAVFSESTSKHFHLTPFKHIWRSPVTGQEQWLYDKLYCSDAWNNAHDELQKEKREDNCLLERVITGLMFWSDTTHLAQFGQAKAWPKYLFFGNLSKYVHESPSSGACHPIAFIPSVSITFILSTHAHVIVISCQAQSRSFFLAFTQ